MSATDLSMAMPMSIAAPKGRILCVDDEPNILRALCWLLQKEFEVVTATSGHEALVRLGEHDFDVVISDQRMPEMTGVDFLQQVKSMAPRAMRILLTGYSDLNAVLQSVNEAEIFRYVTKPWNVTELPRIVAQAAEIARHQPARVSRPENLASPETGEGKILVLDDDLLSHAAVELCAGDLAPVVHAVNVADAIHQLQNDSIGIMVTKTCIGSVDLTRLICLLKQRHPQVVSIVLAEETGTDIVMKLVNQGQVFRFLPKPIQAAGLRETLRSALGRSGEIRLHPELARRYEADELPEEDLASLQADLGASVPHRAADKKGSASFLGGRMGGFLRRFFAAEGNHA